jgi:hypothetical protein
MLSLSEISDRCEIQQPLVDYSTAIDQRRFDDLDGVFTPDAYIDYRATIRRSRAGWRAVVRRRVRPDARGLADEPPGREQMLRQGGVTRSARPSADQQVAR